MRGTFKDIMNISSLSKQIENESRVYEKVKPLRRFVLASWGVHAFA